MENNNNSQNPLKIREPCETESLLYYYNVIRSIFSYSCQKLTKL